MNSPYDLHAQRRILLLDDDPAQRRIIGHWLRQVGYQVDLCPSGEAALTQLLHHRYEVLIADHYLPGRTGLEVARYARQRWPEMGVLLMSATKDVRVVQQAVGLGIDGFLLKPLVVQDVLGSVEHLFQQRQARKASRRRILAIGAHPDDVELGVGGTLARHAAEGDQVHILTLTGGAQGGQACERVAESRAAAAIIGARLHMADLPDTALSPGSETIAVIAAVIRAIDPCTVYTHSLNDTHQDHRAAHQATLVAARRVPNLYTYQSPSTTLDFRPRRFVPVRDTLEQKLSMLRAHASQGHRPYIQPELIAATARYWGRFAGFSMVEPLEIERESVRVSNGTLQPTQAAADLSLRS